MKRKVLQYGIGLVVTGVALWLTLRGLEWGELRESFARIDYFWVVLAVVNSVLTVYILGFRWRLLLREKKEIPLGYLFQLNIISQYVNIIVPGRFGELAKAWLPAKRYEMSGSYVLGTVLIERMFEFFAWVILWVTVPMFIAFRGKLKGYSATLIACGVIIVLIILVVLKREMVRRWILFFARILPAKLRQRVVNFLDRGMEPFAQLKSKRTILMLSLYTGVIILLSSLSNYLLFKAFGLDLPFLAALIVLLMIWFGHVPPSTPGRIGIFEYVVIAGLSIYGISHNEAFSYGVMLHLVSYLPKLILGFIFMGNMNLSLKKAGEEFGEIKPEVEKN